MKVCIAEKPSVAREIASVLGATSSKGGYFEGNGYQVTWTFGHFCTLKEPHEYAPQWKRWSLEYLPMIPPRFGIKLINDSGVKKQFQVIEYLLSKASEVINCGDAGQEGELIQRWVLQKANCKCPIKRLWISSLTEESIREGFNKLHDANDFNKLYEAGLSRAIGDWLLGMNATRLYTVKYGRNHSVLSIGRVQTPTLALIVNRHLEIENFVPEPYWELKTVYRETTFSPVSGRFSKQEDAETVLNSIKDAEFKVTDVGHKEGLEYPPRLFDLTALQVDCNNKFAFSADDTLKTIQSLYEKKLTTYPRVDTSFLSDDLYPKIPAIMRGLAGYETLTNSILANKKIKKDKRVFDNKKVTDHHAIIPTGVRPTNMTSNESKVYDLVTRRFIAAFYPACKVSTTTVLGESNNIKFKTTGKQILDQGWRVVFNKETSTNEEEENILPSFSIGETGVHQPSIQEKQTTPPRPYTEATLLRTMETAGKLVDDDNLRDALKENGIGRPSTRASIIETLFKRNYIKKEKKALLPTLTGIQLILTIQEELLKSAELTGIWENKLRQIEKGTFEPQIFISELKEMVANVVANEKQTTGQKIAIEVQNSEEKKTEKKKNKPKTQKKTPQQSRTKKKLICPICKKGEIIRGNTAYGCANWKTGCNFILKFSDVGDSLTDDDLTNLLNKL